MSDEMEALMFFPKRKYEKIRGVAAKCFLDGDKMFRFHFLFPGGKIGYVQSPGVWSEVRFEPITIENFTCEASVAKNIM